MSIHTPGFKMWRAEASTQDTEAATKTQRPEEGQGLSTLLSRTSSSVTDGQKRCCRSGDARPVPFAGRSQQNEMHERNIHSRHGEQPTNDGGDARGADR